MQELIYAFTISFLSQVNRGRPCSTACFLGHHEGRIETFGTKLHSFLFFQSFFLPMAGQRSDFLCGQACLVGNKKYRPFGWSSVMFGDNQSSGSPLMATKHCGQSAHTTHTVHVNNAPRNCSFQYRSTTLNTAVYPAASLASGE